MSLKSFEKVETNIYSVEVSISAEQLRTATEKAYQKAKKNIAIPGFRKGKVPKIMIEKLKMLLTYFILMLSVKLLKKLNLKLLTLLLTLKLTKLMKQAQK